MSSVLFLSGCLLNDLNASDKGPAVSDMMRHVLMIFPIMSMILCLFDVIHIVFIHYTYKAFGLSQTV